MLWPTVNDWSDEIMLQGAEAGMSFIIHYFKLTLRMDLLMF